MLSWADKKNPQENMKILHLRSPYRLTVPKALAEQMGELKLSLLLLTRGEQSELLRVSIFPHVIGLDTADRLQWRFPSIAGVFWFVDRFKKKKKGEVDIVMKVVGYGKAQENYHSSENVLEASSCTVFIKNMQKCVSLVSWFLHSQDQGSWSMKELDQVSENSPCLALPKKAW